MGYAPTNWRLVATDDAKARGDKWQISVAVHSSAENFSRIARAADRMTG